MMQQQESFEYKKIPSNIHSLGQKFIFLLEQGLDINIRNLDIKNNNDICIVRLCCSQCCIENKIHKSKLKDYKELHLNINYLIDKLNKKLSDK